MPDEGIFDEYGCVDVDALCRAAQVDPNETITRFVMEDYAGLVAALVDDEILTYNEAIDVLRHADLSELEDILCDVSHWPEIWSDHIELSVLPELRNAVV